MYPTESLHICEACHTVVCFGEISAEYASPKALELANLDRISIDLTAPSGAPCQTCPSASASATITLYA